MESPQAREGAQRWTYVGGIVGLGLFFLGFMVIGGNWFIM